MEHITVAGSPDPVPTSAVAEKLLRDRRDATRQKRGDEAAERLETLVGERIATLLEAGTPSIDFATMRSIVDYIELPDEDENTTGIGRALQNVKDKLAQRGGPR